MISLPTPEMLIVTLLFAGIGYVQNEYVKPKYALATLSSTSHHTETVRLYRKVTKSKYFCPSYCAVNHHHFVHKKDECNQTSCNHTVIDSVMEYIKIEEHNKRTSGKGGSTYRPPIRIAPQPGNWDL